MPKPQSETAATAEDEGRRKPRRLRSSTVILGGMGVLAAALSACGSEPDRRCVDRDSYDSYDSYKVLDDSQCRANAGGGGGRAGKGKGRTDAQWYYDSDPAMKDRVGDGSFVRPAVSSGGFGCSGKSGSYGG